MPYITTCFYCQKSLQLRESILVKASLSREILHRYHPGCYAELTEEVAKSRLEYNQALDRMRDAKVQARSPG